MKTPQINHYWHPTPVFWRKIGDSLLAVGSLSGTIAMAEEMKWLALALVLSGIAGKFLTNFFKADPE